MPPVATAIGEHAGEVTQAVTPGPEKLGPVYVLVQELPPSVDLKIRLLLLWGNPPPPSFMPGLHVACGLVAGI